VLSKKYRLPKEKFQYIYKNGKKLRGKYGMLVFAKQEKAVSPRIGFVVSKKIGNSVKRHHMTRLLRNIFTLYVKENNFGNSPAVFEYIAFEYCSDYKILKDEFSKQLSEAFKK
jgi:ribonuclease P protein component